MSEGAQQQNPDGSWSTAVPLGWQGPEDQVDWEVYRRDDRWVGEGYNRMTHVGTTKPCRTKLGAMLAARRVTGRHRMTFLWDDK